MEKVEHLQGGEHLLQINSMQIELAKRWSEKYANDIFDDQTVERWVEANSKRFHEILNAKIGENPNLWEEIKDKSRLNALLDEIEMEIDPNRLDELKQAA